MRSDGTAPVAAVDLTPKSYVDTRSLPAGGTAGQVLGKLNGTDYAAAWTAMRRVGVVPPPGQYMNPTNLLTSGNATPQPGTAYLMPIDPGIPLPLQSLAANLVTAQSGGSGVASLAIYADDGSGGMPDFSKLLASGTVDPTTAAGFKPIATTITLPPGNYWSCFLLVTSGTVSTASVWFGPSNAVSLWSASPGVATRALAVTGLTALPTAGATVSPVLTNVCPIVSPRRAS